MDHLQCRSRSSAAPRRAAPPHITHAGQGKNICLLNGRLEIMAAYFAPHARVDPPTNQIPLEEALDLYALIIIALRPPLASVGLRSIEPTKCHLDATRTRDGR